MFVSAIISSICLVVLGSVSYPPGPVLYYSFTCVFNFFAMSMRSVLYAYTPEIYPTFYRSGGHGLAMAMGRLAAIAVLYAYDGAASGAADDPTFLDAVLLGVMATALAFLPVDRRGLPMVEEEDVEEVATTSMSRAAAARGVGTSWTDSWWSSFAGRGGTAQPVPPPESAMENIVSWTS